MSKLRRADSKTSETTARLVLTGDKTKAWLEPISSQTECDLILEGKGEGGRVYIAENEGIFPVLTVNSLGNIEELAAVLAGITIEGADPAAVAAIAANVQSLQDFVTANLNGLYQVLGGNPPSLVGVANWVEKVYDNFDTVQAIINALAKAAPGVNAPLNQGIAGINNIFSDIDTLANYYQDLVNTFGEFSGTLNAEVAAAIQALVDGGQLGTGGGGPIDEAAVQALIDASLAGIGPILMQAIQSQLGHLTDKLYLDSSVAADGPFIISTNNLTGAQWRVGIDFQTQRGADVTVNGKRVLTEDDSVGGGGAVDTAAIIQAVVDYLETQGLNGEDPRVQEVMDILAQQINATLPDVANFYTNLFGRLELVENKANDTVEWADNQFNELRDQIAALTGLTPEQETALNEAVDLAQGVVNILGGKPGGGGTLADVAAVFGNLGATFQAQLDDAVTSITGEFQTLLDTIGGKPDSTMAEVQAFFTNMQQAVGEAIASVWKAAPDKITLNIRSANATDKVTIEAWQLTPHPPAEARAVDVDINPYGDGVLTVKGKRVLTVDDALAAGGGGIDQAALEAAVQAATAPLLARIDALETELAKRPTTEYMQEQFGNFNDLLTADISQTAQLALAEQKKLQDVMNVFGGRPVSTVADVKVNWDAMAEWVAQIHTELMNTINEVIEYLITEYATKTDVENFQQGITELVTQLMQAIVGPGATPSPVEVAAYFTQLKAEIAEVGSHITEYVDEALQEKIPVILEALSTHLENTLAIFTAGGTPGQVVTPAQLTQLLADIARDYATKDQLTNALQPYAKKDDSDQEITARVVTTRGVLFSISDEVLAPVDYDDYGTRLSVVPKNATSVDDAGIVVVHTDLADLVPVATREIAPTPAPAWVPVTYTGGASGTVEARVLNGTVFFRGQLVKNHAGDPLHVFTLPAGIPAPPTLVDVAVPGEEAGVAYRIASLQIRTDGRVFLIAPLRVTHTTVSDLSYLTEP